MIAAVGAQLPDAQHTTKVSALHSFGGHGQLCSCQAQRTSAGQPMHVPHVGLGLYLTGLFNV
jgi:hypothetical protein